MEKVILYYKYVDIQYPEQIRKWQRALCESLSLKGRIILAHEGINGTVSGAQESVEKYIEAMNSHDLFQDIDFKMGSVVQSAFPKLKISVKNEIVHLGVDPEMVTVRDSGRRLTPDETHQLLTNPPKNFVFIDTRNDYEIAIGKFNHSIDPNLKTFRELPKYIDDNLESFKDKTVLMTCTGGVRCERATAYLKQKNVARDVLHMDGGIHRYIEKYPDGHFRGKNYVFDQRIAVAANNDVLGTCHHCQKPCDDYTNCLNVLCNNHFISCKNCVDAYQNTCSARCKNLIETNQVQQRKPLEKIAC
jgi:UPF0176 protein